MSDRVLVELARRGDLTVVQSRVTGRIGLLRDDGGVPAAPACTFDRAEWRWLLVCAAPVVLQVLGPESDQRAASAGSCRPVGEAGQSALEIRGA